MVVIADTVRREFQDLLALGDEIAAGIPPLRGTTLAVAMRAAGGIKIAIRSFSEWRAASLSALQRTFGLQHSHTIAFDQCATPHLHNLEAGQGILAAALRDVEQGHLSTLRQLLAAEVFNDFLEMAAHLLDSGYKDPAASLVGGVLEDGLRRIASARELTVTTSDNLKSLNDRLHQKGVYNVLEYRQIHTWNGLRDRAAHGHYTEYDSSHVQAMLAGVREFLAKYL